MLSRPSMVLKAVPAVLGLRKGPTPGVVDFPNICQSLLMPGDSMKMKHNEVFWLQLVGLSPLRVVSSSNDYSARNVYRNALRI